MKTIDTLVLTLVNPNAVVRDLVRRTPALNGVVFTYAAEILDYLVHDRDRVALVLIDCQKSEALDLITALARTYQDLPVIALVADEFSADAAQQAGADDALVLSEVTPYWLERAARAHTRFSATRASCVAIRDELRQTAMHAEAVATLFSQAVEQSPVSIVITDLDGKITYVNPRFTALTGYTLNEVAGENPRFLKTGHTSDAEYRQLWENISSGHEWRGEFLNKKKNGETYWESALIAPVRDADGNIHSYLGVKEDITAIKAAAESLQESRALHQAMFDDHVAVMLLVDPDTGAIVDANSAACAYYGYSREHMLTLRIMDINTLSPEQLRDELRNAAERKRNYWIFKHRLADGSIRDVEVRSTLVSSEGRALLYSIVHDITARVAAEDNIRRINEGLQLLNRVFAAASSSLDEFTLLRSVCDTLKDSFAARRVLAYRYDGDTQRYEILGDRDAPEADLRLSGQLLMIDPEVVGLLRGLRLPMVVDQGQQQDKWHWLLQLITRLESALVIPLIIGDYNSGVLIIGAGEDTAFSEETLLLAASIGQAVSQGIANSLLHRSVRDQSARLEDMVIERTSALNHLNEQTTALLNNTSDAILLVRSDGRIESVNRSFSRLFGYSETEVIGRSIDLLAVAEHRRLLLHTLRRVEGGVPHQSQLRVSRSDDTVFDADIAIATVEDDSQRLVCSIRDISHLKETERLKDRFVSMVNHELRSPVAGMMLGTSKLLNYYHRMTDEQRIVSIERLVEQIGLMSEMIESILDLSRVDMASAAQPAEMIDTQQVLRKVLAELQPLLDAKQQSLVITGLRDCKAALYGSPLDIKRIWRNLISNAIKYTQHHGEVQIDVKVMPLDAPRLRALQNGSHGGLVEATAALVDGDYLVATVSDNGPGIPADNLPQIFDRFYRGWASESNITGTGLGLALVKELVTAYSGMVWVASELGHGARFTFVLPVATRLLPV
jgi:PAS domain S-box-containing protein